LGVAVNARKPTATRTSTPLPVAGVPGGVGTALSMLASPDCTSARIPATPAPRTTTRRTTVRADPDWVTRSLAGSPAVATPRYTLTDKAVEPEPTAARATAAHPDSAASNASRGAV